MIYEVKVGDRTALVHVKRHAVSGYVVSIDGAPARHLQAGPLGAAEWFVADARGRRTVAVHLSGETVSMQLEGHGLSGTVIDPRRKALAAGKAGNEGVIRTPMPGAVARVLVAPGAVVMAGQVLVVIEAMKMENEFKSPIAGTVLEVPVQPGTTVDANTVLAIVEAAP